MGIAFEVTVYLSPTFILLFFEVITTLVTLIFFVFDLEDYEQARSFYMVYKDFVPGEIVYETSGIIAAIHNIEESFDTDKIRLFKETYMDACDGNSTQHVIE